MSVYRRSSAFHPSGTMHLASRPPRELASRDGATGSLARKRQKGTVSE
jgi:hypothetical protein